MPDCRASPGAAVWTERTSNTTLDFSGPKVVFGAYLYLAAGSEILRSIDGLTWERVQVADSMIQAMAESVWQ